MFADFNTLLRQQQYARDFRFLLRDVRTPEMTLTSLLSCYSFEMYSQRDDEVLTDDIHKWSILCASKHLTFHPTWTSNSRAFCVPPAIHAKDQRLLTQTSAMTQDHMQLSPISRNVWEILNCPQNVLQCNKIVPPAQLTCVVAIPCVSRTFGGD